MPAAILSRLFSRYYAIFSYQSSFDISHYLVTDAAFTPRRHDTPADAASGATPALTGALAPVIADSASAFAGIIASFHTLPPPYACFMPLAAPLAARC
jgi:hypothetical protein